MWLLMVRLIQRNHEKEQARKEKKKKHKMYSLRRGGTPGSVTVLSSVCEFKEKPDSKGIKGSGDLSQLPTCEKDLTKNLRNEGNYQQ